MSGSEYNTPKGTSPEKDRKAAYIAALEAEKASYLRVGRKDRAAEVDAELKRVQGRKDKPKAEKPVVSE
jgi:hypothetical protein